MPNHTFAALIIGLVSHPQIVRTLEWSLDEDGSTVSTIVDECKLSIGRDRSRAAGSHIAAIFDRDMTALASITEEDVGMIDATAGKALSNLYARIYDEASGATGKIEAVAGRLGLDLRHPLSLVDDFYGANRSSLIPVRTSEHDHPDDNNYGPFDTLVLEAAAFIIDSGYASTAQLQQRFSIGHPRSIKIMKSLEHLGVVGPHEGTKPRQINVGRAELAILAKRIGDTSPDGI